MHNIKVSVLSTTACMHPTRKQKRFRIVIYWLIKSLLVYLLTTTAAFSFVLVYFQHMLLLGWVPQMETLLHKTIGDYFSGIFIGKTLHCQVVNWQNINRSSASMLNIYILILINDKHFSSLHQYILWQIWQLLSLFLNQLLVLYSKQNS